MEHLSILSNSTDNNFTGVTFYCDDEAIACNLPHNVRASEIAACAGKHAEVSILLSCTNMRSRKLCSKAGLFEKLTSAYGATQRFGSGTNLTFSLFSVFIAI